MGEDEEDELEDEEEAPQEGRGHFALRGYVQIRPTAHGRHVVKVTTRFTAGIQLGLSQVPCRYARLRTPFHCRFD